MRTLRSILIGSVLWLALWTGTRCARAQTAPPVILVQPNSATVNLGATVTLSVVADFGVTYQWRLNGANIDGANGSTYVIPSVGLTNLGSYRVIVSNPLGTVQSNPALLILNALPQPPTNMPNDNFADAFDISTHASPITSVMAGTTAEPDEPKHAGKTPTQSVWYTWSTTADGVATFETTGSTFDTVLAVYTGTQLASLVPVASDDDASDFFRSRARFNVRAGVVYSIAIDTLGTQTGPFILAWDFERARVPLPTVRSQPRSKSVPPGSSTTLSVSANDTTGYQWFFNGDLLTNATSSSLSIAKVQREDVGSYFVRLSNDGAFTADSEPATLEIGPVEEVFSYNKLIDLRDVSLPTGGGGGGGGLASFPSFDGGGGGAVSVPGFVSVSIGGLGQQILNNTNSTVEFDACFECDLVGNASRWYGFEPQHSGIMTVDTVGSDVDTILGVYLDVNAGAFCQSLQACDTNGAPNGINSQVSFFAHAQTRYIVGINSQSDQEGIIHLNYQLCTPVPPFSMVDTQVVLEVEPHPAGIYDYYWKVDKSPLATTVSPSLALNPLDNTARAYSVTYSNMTTSVTTNLGALLNLNFSVDQQAAVFRLQMTAVDDLSYQIETAYPDQLNCYGNWLWLPADLSQATNYANGKLRTYEFPIDHPYRFFRLRPAPPPLP